MKWYLSYSSTLQCKSHIFPEELKVPIVENLTRRDCGKQILREESSSIIDLPGPMMTDRFLCEFEISGFKLKIPASDLEFFFSEIKKLPKRKELKNKTYYKLHGGYVCICLLPKQKEELEKQIIKELPKAKVIAEVERGEFVRRVKMINEQIKKEGKGGATFVTKETLKKDAKEEISKKKKEFLN